MTKNKFKSVLKLIFRGKVGLGKSGSEERGVGRKFKDKVEVMVEIAISVKVESKIEFEVLVEVELKIEMKTKWVAFLKLTYAPIKVFKFIT